MDSVGAIIFLPREGANERPLLLEDLLFSPAALWLSKALQGAGVSRFLVVCHDDDRAAALSCFPLGTEFVTTGTADAGEKLSAFLDGREGKVVVVTKPSILSEVSAANLFRDTAPLDEKDTGICRIEAQTLADALAEGVSFETALRERADRPGGRSIWFQEAYPLRNFPDSRMEAEMVVRTYGAWRLMNAGVRLMDANSVYVDPTVIVGEGTVILPGVILRGSTVIGNHCEIGPNTMIRDCTIGDRVTINASQLNESTVESGSRIGPFAYVRPHCHVGQDVKVGDFVELKNANIGEGTKISHLTYVGDSDVGKNVNFGCGTVTVNYDGSAKFRTTIGNNAFIGCNTNLVAPVRVGDGAYTAAGSTITNDVPNDSLAIARTAQSNKIQWAAKRRRTKPKK